MPLNINCGHIAWPLRINQCGPMCERLSQNISLNHGNFEYTIRFGLSPVVSRSVTTNPSSAFQFHSSLT